MLPPRQSTIWWVVLGVGFAVLGAVSLATDGGWIGVGYLLVGVAWGVVALLAWRKPERVRNPEGA